MCDSKILYNKRRIYIYIYIYIYIHIYIYHIKYNTFRYLKYIYYKQIFLVYTFV